MGMGDGADRKKNHEEAGVGVEERADLYNPPSAWEEVSYTHCWLWARESVKQD